MMLGGPQNRSGSDGEEKNSQMPPRIEPLNPDRPARSQSIKLAEMANAVKYSAQQNTQYEDGVWLWKRQVE
jgi:hypothetical protein